MVRTKTKTFSIHKNTQEKEYEVVKKSHDGKDYLVVPVVMMVEGVHNGNKGPLLHLMEELGKVPESWNGIPVVIDHPEKDGQAVSANDPEVLEEYMVGKIFNTHVDGSKLRAEAWVEIEKAEKISAEILQSLQDGELIEVSIGVFTDEDDTEGDWNGEHYISIARNHKPDHLALLPQAVGACSADDGCGIRAYKDKDGKEISIEDILPLVRIEGYKVSKIKLNKKAGFREMMDSFYSIFGAMDREGVYHYMEELYDDNVVYSRNTNGEATLYKQGYEFESGKIELTGEPVEVHRKVEYIVNKLSRTKFKKEEKVSTNKENTPCCPEKVDALIANEQSKFTADDKEMLLTLNAEQLEKFEPTVVEKEVTKEVNVLSKEDQEALKNYRKEQKDKREAKIKEIQANAGEETWPTDALENMSEDILDRVFKSTKPEGADFSLAENGRKVIETNEEMLEPTGVKFEDETKKE